jgi:hypothetical protein
MHEDAARQRALSLLAESKEIEDVFRSTADGLRQLAISLLDEKPVQAEKIAARLHRAVQVLR